jgi:hypothetical protein
MRASGLPWRTTTTMSMVPAPPTSLALLDETVTIPLTDLYDLLTRKGLTMTEPKTKPVKRGYRRVTMLLPAKDYEYLSRLAAEQTRDPAQQALYLLRQKLEEVSDDRLNAVSFRERDNGEALDAHGIELGEVTRTE